MRAQLLGWIGGALVYQGKYDEARAVYDEALAIRERALKLREADVREPIALAETRFDLARALWATKKDRKRAVELAKLARAEYEKAGPAFKKKLPEIERWLRKRRGR
jgi:hypothetical protein